MSANLNQTKWADHVVACSELANTVAEKMDIRDDSARQAMLATIIISADRHNLFLEPTPPNGKAPIKTTDSDSEGVLPAGSNKPDLPLVTERAPQRATPPKGEVVGGNLGALRDPTPEQAEGAKRTELLKGIEQARMLLIKEGYTPTMTPKALNEVIKADMNISGGVGVLDVEQLEFLIKKMNTTLDTFRANKEAMDADAPF